MATNYIKVSPHVARKTGLDSCRATFPDGNYILWEKDLAKADPDWAFHPEQTLAEIGGVLFNPWDAKLEMGRKAEDCTPLPVPTSDIWKTPGTKTDTAEPEEPPTPETPETSEETEPTEEPQPTDPKEPEPTEPTGEESQPEEPAEENNEPLNAE